jgi:hypothetical protein
MFVMIANMRMAVGGMGLGMASAAADLALSYARERLQGGRGPSPVPIIEHADVQRMVLGVQAEVGHDRGEVFEGLHAQRTEADAVGHMVEAQGPDAEIGHAFQRVTAGVGFDNGGGTQTPGFTLQRVEQGAGSFLGLSICLLARPSQCRKR